MNQHSDLDGITLSSIKACVISIQAHGPLTRDQRDELNKIYNMLLELTADVAHGKSS